MPELVPERYSIVFNFCFLSTNAVDYLCYRYSLYSGVTKGRLSSSMAFTNPAMTFAGGSLSLGIVVVDGPDSWPNSFSGSPPTLSAPPLEPNSSVTMLSCSK